MGRDSLIKECKQPFAGKHCHKEVNYCLCEVYEKAKQRCIDKGEEWRWGVKE
jgi:hypothetical protein